jgi:uncharacterized membrane protein YfcA
MIPAILSATALVAATLSGVIGMGGGLLLLTVMAMVLDPLAVVPIHGVVQMASNGTRTLRLLREVEWGIFFRYVPMLGFGVWVGRSFYAGADAAWFKPVVGAFVLLALTWDLMKPRRMNLPAWVLLPGGFVGGMLTVMVGATGPYLATFFLRDDLHRRQVVATKAAIQTVGHLAKIPAFLSLGFDYVGAWPVMVPMVVAAIAGTFLGTTILGRLPERAFKIAFRVLLAALAAKLIIGS